MNDRVKEWLTPAGAAKLLGCSPNTARNYADAGQVEIDGVVYPIKVMRVGPLQARRLRTADVEKLAHALQTLSEP